MSKPIAVLTSDLHFNLNTLDVATKALTAALDQAAHLGVPTVIAGDLHDTKDIIRGKVANRLISLLKQAKTPVYILTGNHDLLNEKHSDHGLNYLAPYANISDVPRFMQDQNVFFIPYMSNLERLHFWVRSVKKYNPILIMHQGFLGAQMGDYIQDKTSISPEVVKDYTVISGHYHRHQTIGTVTYIGSPYTVTFGEANDGPKGFLVLNSDGTFTREILNLRKHVIIEAEKFDGGVTIKNSVKLADLNPDDLIWVKLNGPKSLLNTVNKKELGEFLFGHSNFKLDLIEYKETKNEAKHTRQGTDAELLDALIDESQETDERKQALKQLWRNLHD